MKKILFQGSEELLIAIDEARGDVPRNPWIETQLWKNKAIRAAAKVNQKKKPHRLLDGRGKWNRKKH